MLRFFGAVYKYIENHFRTRIGTIRVLFTDVDGTLTRRRIGTYQYGLLVLWYRYDTWLQRFWWIGMVLPPYVFYLLGRLKAFPNETDLVYRGIHSYCFKGLHRTRCRTICEKHLCLDVREKAKEFIEKLGADRVVCITASPQDVYDPVLSGSVGEVIGTKLAYDDDGYYTGEVWHLMNGPNKAIAKSEYLRSLEGTHETWGMGDTKHDIELLESVDHAIVVDPDETLGKRANRNHWVFL